MVPKRIATAKIIKNTLLIKKKNSLERIDPDVKLKSVSLELE